VPGIFLSDIYFNNISNTKNINDVLKINESEFEILINRNLKIKITDIKKIKLKNRIYSKKIEKIYKETKNIKTKSNGNNENVTITVIFAESCPYQLPLPFELKDNFKYICSKVNE
jgi:hypothetical protein